MTTRNAARLFVSTIGPVAVHSRRNTLLRGCAVSALALGLTVSGTASFAACLTIGDAYPCFGPTDFVLDAGPNNNLVYSGGATGNLTVNGQGGSDSIVFGEASNLAPKSGTTLVDAGDGDDAVTAQGASVLSGNILGGDGADNILIEGASTLTGNVDGGLGADILTLRNAGTTVTGNFAGGDGADTITLQDDSVLTGDIDAGAGADRVVLELGSTLDGDLLAGADADTVLIRGGSTVTGDVKTEDGADLLTIQEQSVIEGSVLTGGGDDTALLEGDTLGGPTIEGDFDAGAGNDSMRIRGASIVKGDVLGDTGDDAIVVSDGSTVEGDVDAGDDNDQVTVQTLGVVKGSVLGGAGNDSLLVEGNATVEGALSGGTGNDTMNVTSGEVQGGISGGDGNDTANLTGGKIGGFDGLGSLDLGAGDDTLNLGFDDTLGADALDVTGISMFDGGDGANSATLTGFGASYSEGGLFYRHFDQWDSVTAVGTFLQFSQDATITTLDLTSSSALFQTGGTLALTAADGSDTAKLIVDDTSYVDLRDAAFAAMLPVSNLPLSVVSFPVLPQSTADDSLTVADLDLTGSATPLTLTTLRVDFDADDTTYRNGRDDAVSGNADQIDVSTSITTTGVIGIRIDAVGGALNMGMPVGLSGSVAIIDDLQSAALSRPGVGATLVASTTYVADSNIPVDPARQWALVDQGNGGVYLQWTTALDAVTLGPNAGAELSLASGGVAAMSSLLAGFADGSIAKRPLCSGTTIDCALSPASVWVTAGAGSFRMGTAKGFEGFDATNRTLTGGIEYAIGQSISGGVFASLQQGSTDLGSTVGAFGLRASNASHSAGYVGSYLRAEQGGAYLTALGALGKANSDLVNGTLFGATSSHDSTVAVIAATAGKRMALGSGFELDPRVEASYATSGSDAYTDDQGLTVDASATQTRLAATLGLTYRNATSPLSLTLRAGTAFLVSDTTTAAGETGAALLAGIGGHRSDRVFTASIEGRYNFTDNAALVGSISADDGADISAARGGLTFTYAF